MAIFSNVIILMEKNIYFYDFFFVILAMTQTVQKSLMQQLLSQKQQPPLPNVFLWICPKKGLQRRNIIAVSPSFSFSLLLACEPSFFWQQFNPSCTLWIWFYLLRFYKITFYMSFLKESVIILKDDFFICMYYKEFDSFYKLLTCFLFQHWQYWPHTCLFKQGFITYQKVLQTYY